MRYVGLLVLASPLLAACMASGGQSFDQGERQAAASCVGPYLDAQPPSGTYGAPAPTVHPGQSLTIYGHWYTSTCNDTGADHDPLEPLAPVRLSLRLPGGAVLALGKFAPAGRDMGFAVPIQIPATTAGGTAVMSDDQDHTYRFAVTGA